MKLNTIDLFAGCGGLTDGFKASGNFNLLAAVEWDLHAINTLRNRLKTKYNYKNPSEVAIHFDIQKTDELLNGFEGNIEFKPFDGLNKLVGNKNVDVIIGGPPCQAYSVAGRIRDDNGMHDDYRNFLFESYLRVVNHFKPPVCIFENVPGMLSAKPGGILILERILSAFRDCGYDVSEKLGVNGVFNCSEFGVPQNRKRVIIIAIRKDVPNSSKVIEEFYSELNSKKSVCVPTVKDAISDLPKLFPIKYSQKKKSHEANKQVNIYNHIPRFHNSRDIEIFKLLASDIEEPRNEYCNAEKLKELYTQKTGKTSSVHKYYVLRWDKPSNTIPAHLYKDGLRHIHPDPLQARSITVREAARFQSFSDDYEFLSSSGANYKMIGNAVPPLFAKEIAESVQTIFHSKIKQ